MLSAYRGNSLATSPSASGKPILVSVSGSQQFSLRVVTSPDGTTFAVNADTTDEAIQVNTQGAGVLTMSNPTGTPTQGQRLVYRLKSTNVQTFAWDTKFRGSSQVALPTTSTGGSKTDYLQFMYNATDSKWDLIGFNFGFT